MSDLVSIDFYGDTIQARRTGEGPRDVEVSIRRLCDNLGVAVQSQLEKLKRAPWACVTMTVTHDTTGRTQSMAMLPLRSVPMWLASIDADRVAAHVREKLVRYQLECADVLADHFAPKVEAAASVVLDLDSREGLLALSSQLTEKLIATTQRALVAETKVAEQAEIIAIAAPKVEVFDRIVDCGDTEGFRSAAKLIFAATGANENEVRSLMLKREWIRRLDGRLMPAHTGTMRGYVTTRDREWSDGEGSQHVKAELRITQKGIARAIELFLKAESA